MGFSTVMFDFDSTIVSVETLNEMVIAASKDAVSARQNIDNFCARISVQYKKERSEGVLLPTVDFHDTLIYRLGLNLLTKEDEKSILSVLRKSVIEGMDEVIKILLDRGVDVYIVSAGFRSFIVPIAEMLGIEKEKVLANDFLYNDNGQIVGFNIHNDLTKFDGKVRAVNGIIGNNTSRVANDGVAMVGDGYSDWLVGQMVPGVTYCYFYNTLFSEELFQGSEHRFKDSKDLLCFLASR